MGCSNPHPHCQIWASDFLPTEPSKKDVTQLNYYLAKGRPMLLDYLADESKAPRERIILENSSWVVLVPFWATWPFEVMLMPKEHVIRLDLLNEYQKRGLCDVMKNLLVIYDNLFQTDFPYSMGWHGAPTGNLIDRNNDHWQLHALYYPPLVRSATIKKFMVGYEMLAMPQRDITPELASSILKALPLTHYTEKSEVA